MWKTYKCNQSSQGPTLFKLYPNSSIILDLLDHLSIAPYDHADWVSRYWDLTEKQRFLWTWLCPNTFAYTSNHDATHKLTSMPPPMRAPKSVLSLKPPWSLSLRISCTISWACWIAKNMVITVHSNWAAASYLNEMISCMYLYFVGISNNS